MPVEVEVDDAFALTLLRELGAPGDASPRADGAAADDPGPAELARWTRAQAAGNPRFARLLGLAPWFTGARPGPWLALPAALLGLSGAGLAASGELNVLAPPLLGLLLWQLVVYALLAFRAVSGTRAAEEVSRLGSLVLQLPRPWTGLEGPDFARVTRAWLAVAGRTLAARLASTLHLAAAALALGAVAGLYLDGLATAYQARWESTFLGAEAVAMLVSAVLGPASALTGIALPDAAGFAALGAEGLPAAPWIHLWATTLVLSTVAPRLLLAALAARAGRARLSLDEDPWLRRQLALLRGRTLAVTVQPLGYRPGARSHERLAEALLDAFGAHLLADRREPLPWDAEPAQPDAATEELVVMVSAAQTPEEEVHGPLLDALGAGHPLLVAVDVEAYAADARRRASRVSAWTRLAEAHGARVLVLEPPARSGTP